MNDFSLIVYCLSFVFYCLADLMFHTCSDMTLSVLFFKRSEGKKGRPGFSQSFKVQRDPAFKKVRHCFPKKVSSYKKVFSPKKYHFPIIS